MATAKTREELHADWWKDWWTEDYSWDGLANKFIAGTGGVHGERTLQDYWLIDPATGKPRSIAEMQNAGEFVSSPEDKRWHIAHVPLDWYPRNPAKSAWSDTKRAQLAAIIAARIAAAQETAVTQKVFDKEETPAGVDGRAQLQGSILLDPPDHPSGVEAAIHIMATRCRMPAWDTYCRHFGPGSRFDGAAFSGNASFQGATFSGVARFDSATFAGDANFQRANFTGVAQFDGTTFSGDASFEQAKFEKTAIFLRSKFEIGGDARFIGATFSRDVRFVGASFLSYARFDSATFSDLAHFDGTTFSGDASFDEATFTGPVLFKNATFSGDASFGRAAFENRTVFRWAKFEATGDASFERATFSDLAHFGGTTFSGDASFDEAIFSDNTSFDRVKFEKAALFRWSRFEVTDDGGVMSGRMDYGKVVFSGPVDFDGAVFAANPAHHSAAFLGARFADLASFRGCGDHWVAALDEAEIKGRILIDERDEQESLRDFDSVVLPRAKDGGDNPETKESLLKELEGGCRTIKVAMGAARNEIMEQRYYRFQLRARREQAGVPRFERWVSYLFGYSADYGLSLTRPLAGLGILLLVFTVVHALFWHATGSFDDAGAVKSVEMAASRMFPFGAFELVSRDWFDELACRGAYPYTLLCARLFASLQSLLALLLIFLFGLAVRRRFKVGE